MRVASDKGQRSKNQQEGSITRQIYTSSLQNRETCFSRKLDDRHRLPHFGRKVASRKGRCSQQGVACTSTKDWKAKDIVGLRRLVVLVLMCRQQGHPQHQRASIGRASPHSVGWTPTEESEHAARAGIWLCLRNLLRACWVRLTWPAASCPAAPDEATVW